MSYISQAAKFIMRPEVTTLLSAAAFGASAAYLSGGASLLTLELYNAVASAALTNLGAQRAKSLKKKEVKELKKLTPIEGKIKKNSGKQNRKREHIRTTVDHAQAVASKIFLSTLAYSALRVSSYIALFGLAGSTLTAIAYNELSSDLGKKAASVTVEKICNIGLAISLQGTELIGVNNALKAYTKLTSAITATKARLVLTS